MSRESLKKELANTISGKSSEPPLNKDVVTKINLIKILNWYASHAVAEDLKSYITMYAKTVGIKLTSITGSDYSTYGAIARSIIRGFVFESDIVDRLNTYVISQQNLKTRVEPNMVIGKPKPQQPKYENLPIFGDIDIGIDHALELKNYVINHETQKGRINQCLDYINAQQATIDKDLEVGCMSRVSHRRVSDYLKTLRQYYTTAKSTNAVKKPVNKSVVAKKVQFCIDSKDYVNKPILPIDVIGKKKMYCYDINKKMLICYVAILDGFTFSGTTLKNMDEVKSVQKSMSDPKKLTQSLSELNKLLTNIKFKSKVPSPRFSNTTVILATS